MVVPDRAYSVDDGVMRISLKWKVITGCVLLEIIALVIIAGVNFNISNDYLEQIAQHQLQNLKSCLTNEIVHRSLEVQTDSVSSIISSCQIPDSSAYVLLFDKNSRLVDQKGWPGAPLAPKNELSAVTSAVAKLPNKLPHFDSTTPVFSSGYSQIMFGGTTVYKVKAQTELALKTLMLSLLAVVISVLFFWFVASRLGRHLKTLENATKEILKGNYDVSIDYLDDNEIGRVGFAINLITDTLKNEIQALKKSEESERKTAERMLNVIDSVPDFMLLSRMSDGYVIYANVGVEKMTGFSYDELVGKTMNDVDMGITSEQRNDWQNQLIQKGALTNYETIIKHKSGSLINVLVSASLLEIDDAYHVLIICRDITDRKLVEAAVAHANRQLNYVLDAASEIAIIATDIHGIVQMFNRGAEKMLGYRARESIGKPLRLDVHDKDELKLRSQELSHQFSREIPLQEVLMLIPAKQGSETRNWTYICKNGDRLKVSLTVTRVLDGMGKIVGFLGIARDITLQLHAEQALQELNYQLEKRVEERTAELEETNRNLAQTMHNLQLAQTELVRSEKLTALGDIVAVVAHEINTPIGNCLTVATTMRDQCNELEVEITNGTIRKSSLSKYIADNKTGMDILIRGLNRSSELITNFKQVAVDQTSEQRRTFKLNQVINEVVALLMPMLRKTPYRLDITIPEYIVMDSYPGPIEQIISNFINNSVLHAFEGAESGTMTLTAILQHNYVAIEFSDDGKGIPENHLNRIFDPFFTTKLGRGGTGLGLNIVHNIVKKMLGGQIEVSSRAGRGTAFMMLLPLVAPNVTSVEKRSALV